MKNKTDNKMEKNKIKGLIAAIVTPMDKNGKINLSVIDSYAKHLIKSGVNGVFVCGTTGESLLLNTEERKKEAEAWMPYSNDIKIIIHVGSTSYVDAQELARHAEKIGAYAIGAMGPCFLQPDRVQDLVEFNRLIANEAPNTPFYYYHIPGVSGVKIYMLDFLKEADKKIPNLNGIKFTSYDTMEMLECINYHEKKYDILHGHDETLLTGLMLGATGGIGTSYNLTAPLYNQMIDKYYKGDISGALNLQTEAVKFIRVMIKYGKGIAGIKSMLTIAGIDCGPCRLPIQNVSASEMKELEKEMKAFDWL